MATENPSIIKSEHTNTVKRIEIYAFIDPLCSDCFHIQQTLRKLQIKFDHYFTFRTIISTNISALNSKVTNCTKFDAKTFSHPVMPAVAIKAAELQGKKFGLRFLQKVQEMIFLQNKECTTFPILREIAQMINLDIVEFEKDFTSEQVMKAFQCDLHLMREMEVTEVPSIVFFNENMEDEGLKVSGNYSFNVYTEILHELLGEGLVEQTPPSLDELFEKYETLTSDEIAEIYNVSKCTAERELKKRTLLQKIERIPLPTCTHWRIKKYA